MNTEDYIVSGTRLHVDANQITIFMTHQDRTAHVFSFTHELNGHPALSRATLWLFTLYKYTVEQELPWKIPIVPTVEFDEDFVVEWCTKNTALIIYFDGEKIDYLTDDEQGVMKDGDAGDGQTLYRWFITGSYF